MPLGILLAGGRSSRMGGQDKAWMELAGVTLAVRVARRLAAQCSAVVASANSDTDRWAALGLPVVPDDLPDRPGPLAGILAGLDWAARHRPDLAVAVTAATDTPFLPLDLVSRLAGSAGRGVACAAAGGRRHPVVSLWPVGLRHDLRRLATAGEHRLHAVLDHFGAATVAWPDRPYDPFANLNAREDVAEAAETLAAHPNA